MKPKRGKKNVIDVVFTEEEPGWGELKEEKGREEERVEEGLPGAPEEKRMQPVEEAISSIYESLTLEEDFTKLSGVTTEGIPLERPSYDPEPQPQSQIPHVSSPKTKDLVQEDVLFDVPPPKKAPTKPKKKPTEEKKVIKKKKIVGAELFSTFEPAIEEDILVGSKGTEQVKEERVETPADTPTTVQVKEEPDEKPVSLRVEALGQVLSNTSKDNFEDAKVEKLPQRHEPLVTKNTQEEVLNDPNYRGYQQIQGRDEILFEETQQPPDALDPSEIKIVITPEEEAAPPPPPSPPKLQKQQAKEQQEEQSIQTNPHQQPPLPPKIPKKKKQTTKKPPTKKKLDLNIETMDVDVQTPPLEVEVVQQPEGLERGFNYGDTVEIDNYKEFPTEQHRGASEEKREQREEEEGLVELEKQHILESTVQEYQELYSSVIEKLPKVEVQDLPTEPEKDEVKQLQEQLLPRQSPVQEFKIEITKSDAKPKPKMTKPTKPSTKKQPKKNIEVNVERMETFQPVPVVDKEEQASTSAAEKENLLDLVKEEPRRELGQSLQATQAIQSPTPEDELLKLNTERKRFDEESFSQQPTSDTSNTHQQQPLEISQPPEAFQQVTPSNRDQSITPPPSPLTQTEEKPQPGFFEEPELIQLNVVSVAHNKKKKATKTEPKKQKKSLGKALVEDEKAVAKEQMVEKTPEKAQLPDTHRVSSSKKVEEIRETTHKQPEELQEKPKQTPHFLENFQAVQPIPPLSSPPITTNISKNPTPKLLESPILSTLISKVNLKNSQADARIILRQTTSMLREDLLSRTLQRPIKRITFQPDQIVDKYINEYIHLKGSLKELNDIG